MHSRNVDVDVDFGVQKSFEVSRLDKDICWQAHQTDQSDTKDCDDNTYKSETVGDLPQENRPQG
jgi:hypothetical protein